VQAIETVLFDFGGTLDSDGVAWKERFHALYRSEGLDLSADAFAPAFYAADDALVGALAPTTGLEETIDALTTNLEAELARRGGGTGHAEIDRARGQRVASRFLSEMSVAFARNRPVLETLGQRYRLGVVSNFYGNLEAVCESSGLGRLFGVMTDSQRVGAEKPEPAIFHAALTALHAAPGTTVMVGDSLRRDYEGARRSGMRFIWIAPEDVQATERDSAENRSVLAAVTELPDLLDILT
jgi:FMN hydrolase / 5-amino-6-(5-phospho-D-ribitylamino)uracil phosphatase